MKRIYIRQESMYFNDFIYDFSEKSPYNEGSIEVDDKVFDELRKSAESFLDSQLTLTELNPKHKVALNDKHEPRIWLNKKDYLNLRKAAIQFQYLLLDRNRKEFCSTEKVKSLNKFSKEELTDLIQNLDIVCPYTNTY